MIAEKLFSEENTSMKRLNNSLSWEKKEEEEVGRVLKSF